MLTEIEKRYVARGYQLPPGLTWPVVHAHREMLRIEPWLVPIEVAPGAIDQVGLFSGRPFGAVLRRSVGFP